MPSPLDYFGITPPGNPLSAFFPQQGGDDAFRSQLEERPVNRTQIPPEYLVASQLPDPMGFLQQVQQQRGQTEARQAIQGLQNLDFGSKDYPASVAKLLSKYPNAAQNSAVQNILKLKEFSGKQAADTKYNTQAAQAVKQFLAIPEDDPNYDQKFQDFIGGLDADVLQHPRLASLIERGVHNSSSIRSKKTADQQEKQILFKQARSMGIDPSKFDNMEDLNSQIADHMAQVGQRKETMEFFKNNPELRKEYATAMSALRAPTIGPSYDDEKMAAVGVTDPRKMTPELWAQADALAKQQRLQKVRSLNDQMLLMGVNPLSGLPGTSEPRSAPSATGQPQSAPEAISVQGNGLQGDEFTSAKAPVVPAPAAEPQVEPEFTPPPPQGLGNVQQVVQQEQATKAATQAAKELELQQAVPEWEQAKQSLWGAIPKDQIDRIKLGIPVNSSVILNGIGKKPNDIAFKKEGGVPVTWQQVADQALRDPRFEQLVKGTSTPSIPVVNTKSEYDALPSGSVYVDSHGKQARKK